MRHVDAAPRHQAVGAAGAAQWRTRHHGIAGFSQELHDHGVHGREDACMRTHDVGTARFLRQRARVGIARGRGGPGGGQSRRGTVKRGVGRIDHGLRHEAPARSSCATF